MCRSMSWLAKTAHGPLNLSEKHGCERTAAVPCSSDRSNLDRLYLLTMGDQHQLPLSTHDVAGNI